MVFWRRVRKRVIVFGAGGQLAVELIRALAERHYDISAFDRRQADICDAAQVAQVFARTRPSFVLNGAAYNQVDAAELEPMAAFEANALAVRNLALACRDANAQLVHFSTDYVFDGDAGREYTEEDTPRPLGAYAVSKLAGELYARAYLPNPLIIRTAGVFGPGARNTARGNFVETMLRLAQSGNPVRVTSEHFASPTYAPALAERTVELIERGAGGLFHIGGGTAISWFDYARAIFATAGLTPPLRAVKEAEYPTPARRPRFSALSNKKMELYGIAPMPPLEKALERYLAQRGAYAATALSR